MPRLRLLEYGLIAATAAFASLMGVRATAVDCNSKTPTIGQCGNYDPCDGRNQSQCTATYAHYYSLAGPIGCQSGSNDQYCEEYDPTQQNPSEPKMKCTCEVICYWDATNNVCREKEDHVDAQGNQICSYASKHYRSLSCDVPPFGT